MTLNDRPLRWNVNLIVGELHIRFNILLTNHEDYLINSLAERKRCGADPAAVLNSEARRTRSSSFFEERNQARLVIRVSPRSGGQITTLISNRSGSQPRYASVSVMQFQNCLTGLYPCYSQCSSNGQT